MVTISGATIADWNRLDRCAFLGGPEGDSQIDSFISIFNEMRAIFEAKVTDSGTPPQDILIGWELGDTVDRKKWRTIVNTGTGDYNLDFNTGSDGNESWTTAMSVTTAGVVTFVPALDHGALAGLGDDDHTIYTLADGTRAFTGTVAGIDPTADTHLTTRSFVASEISGKSGNSALVGVDGIIVTSGTNTVEIGQSGLGTDALVGDGGITITSGTNTTIIGSDGVGEDAIIAGNKGVVVTSGVSGNSTEITLTQNLGDFVVNTDDATVTGTWDFDVGLTVSGIAVALASEVIATSSGSVTFNFTDTSSITVNHALNTRFLIPTVYTSDNFIFQPQTAEAVDNGTYTINFGSPKTGFGTLVSASGVGGGVNTHSQLAGLLIDDHTIYSLADGTRPFTSTVGGVIPTVDADLATKKYVDDEVISSTFGVDEINVTATGIVTITGNASIDVATVDATLTLSVSESNVDHGGLGGLSDDDHTQYILVAGTRAFTGNQALGTNKFTGLSAGSSAGDSVRFEDVIREDGTNAFTGNQAMGDNSLTGIDTLTFTDTAGTIAGIQNQNLLDKSATETVSGQWEYSTGLTLSGSAVLIAGGGGSALDNVVEDTTPQLGGDLDVNGKTIRSVGTTDINIISADDITLTASGTGSTGRITIESKDSGDVTLRNADSELTLDNNDITINPADDFRVTADNYNVNGNHTEILHGSISLSTAGGQYIVLIADNLNNTQMQDQEIALSAGSKVFIQVGAVEVATFGGTSNRVSDDSVSKGWVNFDSVGGSVTENDKYNVSSVTRNSAGKYTVNWDTDFANATYAWSGSARPTATNNVAVVIEQIDGSGQAAASLAITVLQNGTPTDSDSISVIAFGDLV